MTIKVFSSLDRKMWFAMRHRDVTGSEAAALIGLHRYLTPAQLYADKIGPNREEDNQDAVKTRGARLEPFVAGVYQERHPETTIWKPDTYYRDVEARLGGTPDYLIKDEGVLEIKTVGQRDFVDIWQGGDPNADPVPELWQLIQCQVYMHLTNTKYAKIAVLPVGDWSPMDVIEIDVPRNQKVIDRILQECKEFWQNLEKGIVPAFDYARDHDAIKAIYPDTREGKTLDFRHDEALAKAVATLEEAKEAKRKAEKTIEQMDGYVRAQLRDAEQAIIPGGLLTLRTTHRKGFTVDASSYRTLRFKKDKVLA